MVKIKRLIFWLAFPIAVLTSGLSKVLLMLLKWVEPDHLEKPQESKKPKIVPEEDYDMLRYIHINLARGEVLKVSEGTSKEGQYWHARVLYDFWGMSPEEILQETGFWIEEPQLKETKNGNKKMV